MTTADDYTFDDLGRITLIDIDNGGPKVKLSQSHDAAGNRTAFSAQIDVGGGDVDDFQNTYTYDNLHRLTKIEQTDTAGGNAVADKRVDFSYNAIGQFTKIVRYDDLAGGSTNEVAKTTYAYDGIARLTDLTHVHDTTTIAGYDWTYDAFSRVTSFTSPDGTSDYTYDETGQLPTLSAGHGANRRFSKTCQIGRKAFLFQGGSKMTGRPGRRPSRRGPDIIPRQSPEAFLKRCRRGMAIQDFKGLGGFKIRPLAA